MICSSSTNAAATTRLRIPSSEEEAAAAEALEYQDKRRRPVNLGLFELKTFFTRVMVAAMGCFFSCFGVNKDSIPNSNLEDSSPPTSPAVKVTQNRSPLSSLLLSLEKEGTPTELKEDQDLGTAKPELGFNLKDLKDGAKFLQACGTLPETPAEICEAFNKRRDLSTQKGDHKYWKFRSWLIGTSVEKFNSGMKFDQPPTPIKDCEQWPKVSGSLEHTPGSCMTERQNAGRVSPNSVEGNEIKNVGSIELTASPNNSLTGSSVIPRDIALSTTGKNKSVRFECDCDTPSVTSKSCPSETSTQNLEQSGSASNSSVAKFSPHPTPLKLSDEMQTPGTVFPAYVDGVGQGKSTCIRSQYVNSVLNPVENFSQCKVLKNEDRNSFHQNSHTRESFEQTVDKTPVSEAGTGKTSAGEELKVKTSLSSWLRASHVYPDGNVEHNSYSASDFFHYGQSPGDRPILGMVAAHWNDDGPSQVSPKWWAGNGIPNSTNKYKEDQKVNWHATPFEERLERALSEETFISQRNQNSRAPLRDFNETEESDTALSQLQPSNHFKSVVSF